MSEYTSFIRGMLDSSIKSKKYWAHEFTECSEIMDFNMKADRKKFICDKFILLDNDISLFGKIIKQFVEFDNVK